MKSGIYCSEFWVMVLTKVLVLLVTAGVLSQAKSDTISALLAQAITGATAVWALATMAKSWIEHRSNLKAATAMSAIPDPPIQLPSRRRPVLESFFEEAGFLSRKARITARSPEGFPFGNLRS